LPLGGERRHRRRGPSRSPACSLLRRYGNHEARGISMSVGRGEVNAPLGTNGAGKTTTVEVLKGLAGVGVTPAPHRSM
jgi:ABC-type lipopolysaccharide export system ATPase subunit